MGMMRTNQLHNLRRSLRPCRRRRESGQLLWTSQFDNTVMHPLPRHSTMHMSTYSEVVVKSGKLVVHSSHQQQLLVKLVRQICTITSLGSSFREKRTQIDPGAAPLFQLVLMSGPTPAIASWGPAKHRSGPTATRFLSPNFNT